MVRNLWLQFIERKLQFAFFTQYDRISLAEALTVFVKSAFLDVWLGSEYAFGRWVINLVSLNALYLDTFKMSSSYIIFQWWTLYQSALCKKYICISSVIDTEIQKFLKIVILHLPKMCNPSRPFSWANLRNKVKKFYKNTKVVLFSMLNMQSFFNCKDKIPESVQSFVVY